MDIQRALDALVMREAGFVDHPADKGGPTCWGITEAVARENGYTGAMSAMPVEVAKAIYKRRYWAGPGFDQIGDISPRIAEELLDTGVNMGPPVAATFLQRVLNVMNQEAKVFPDLKADGHAGAITRAALTAYLRARPVTGETVMLTALNCLQGAAYIGLAEKSPSQEAFVFGWLANRVVM